MEMAYVFKSGHVDPKDTRWWYMETVRDYRASLLIRRFEVLSTNACVMLSQYSGLREVIFVWTCWLEGALRKGDNSFTGRALPHTYVEPLWASPSCNTMFEPTITNWPHWLTVPFKTTRPLTNSSLSFGIILGQGHRADDTTISQLPANRHHHVYSNHA